MFSGITDKLGALGHTKIGGHLLKAIKMKRISQLVSNSSNLITGSYLQVKTAKLRVINTHRNSKITKKPKTNQYASERVCDTFVCNVPREKNIYKYSGGEEGYLGGGRAVISRL